VPSHADARKEQLVSEERALARLTEPKVAASVNGAASALVRRTAGA
jgi:hypothetical protein